MGTCWILAARFLLRHTHTHTIYSFIRLYICFTPFWCEWTTECGHRQCLLLWIRRDMAEKLINSRSIFIEMVIRRIGCIYYESSGRSSSDTKILCEQNIMHMRLWNMRALGRDSSFSPLTRNEINFPVATKQTIKWEIYPFVHDSQTTLAFRRNNNEL